MGINYPVHFYYGIALKAPIDEETTPEAFENFDDDPEKWFEQYKKLYPHLAFWKEASMGSTEDFEYRLGLEFGHIDGRYDCRVEVKMPEYIPIAEVEAEITEFLNQFNIPKKAFQGSKYWLTFDMA